MTDEQLGTGGFSVVYCGTWLGTPVAIKKWLNNGASESERGEMRGEIMSNAVSSFLQPLSQSATIHCFYTASCWWMQGLRHPNIVTFCGACTEGPSTFMVTELMPFSLLQILYEMPSIGLPVPKVLNMARDICHAFVYLHSRRPRVIHRYLHQIELAKSQGHSANGHAHKTVHLDLRCSTSDTVFCASCVSWGNHIAVSQYQLCLQRPQAP